MISFVAQNWGNVASVAGLIVSAAGLIISLWVLSVAKKAREAAEEARSAARLKSLVEILEEARSKNSQVGHHLMGRELGDVRYLAQEVSDRCWQASARWGDHLAEALRNNLMDAAEITGAIASFASESSVPQLNEERWRKAIQSHQYASKLISTVLGEAQKAEERTK